MKKYFRAVVESKDEVSITKWHSGYYDDQKEAEKANRHYQETRKAQGYEITDHFIQSTRI